MKFSSVIAASLAALSLTEAIPAPAPKPELNAVLLVQEYFHKVTGDVFHGWKPAEQFVSISDVPIPGGSPISLCEEEAAQLIDIESVMIQPNPPERGQNLTIAASGLLKKTIEKGAYVDVHVSFGLIKLLSQTFDLCDEMENVDLKCPLKQGFMTLVKTVELPEEIPPGKYTVVAQAYTVDDELLTCISATVEFPVPGKN